MKSDLNVQQDGTGSHQCPFFFSFVIWISLFCGCSWFCLSWTTHVLPSFLHTGLNRIFSNVFNMSPCLANKGDLSPRYRLKLSYIYYYYYYYDDDDDDDDVENEATRYVEL